MKKIIFLFLLFFKNSFCMEQNLMTVIKFFTTKFSKCDEEYLLNELKILENELSTQIKFADENLDDLSITLIIFNLSCLIIFKEIIQNKNFVSFYEKIEKIIQDTKNIIKFFLIKASRNRDLDDNFDEIDFENTVQENTFKLLSKLIELKIIEDCFSLEV